MLILSNDHEHKKMIYKVYRSERYI